VNLRVYCKRAIPGYAPAVRYKYAEKVIDVKQAVQASVKFAESTLGPERAQQMLVEEVERPEDRGNWVITLSLPVPLSLQVFGRKEDKEYKTFVVDAETGEVKSMKIRQLAA
jgi:hypothetical protein